MDEKSRGLIFDELDLLSMTIQGLMEAEYA